MNLVCIAPRGLEELVAQELTGLGATDATADRGHVRVNADLSVAYDLNLWSRTALRVLVPVATVASETPDDLRAAVCEIDWTRWFEPHRTLSITFTGKSAEIRKTTYGAQVVKDGIVDRFRLDTGERPSISNDDPEVRIHAHLRSGKVELSFDMSGESLHRRGYRAKGARAPMKENLAAAILLLAGWDEALKRGQPLLDPMCGSATMPIEAALMAADIAPGLFRKGRWGFEAWLGHDPDIWAARLQAAKDRGSAGRKSKPAIIVGYDADERAIERARQGVDAVGLSAWVTLDVRAMDEAEPVGDGPGVLVVNPPYGHRIGEERALEVLYGRLGDMFKRRFDGWKAHVLAGDRRLGGLIGLRPERRFPIWNGPIECRLLSFPLRASQGPEAEARGTAESVFAKRLAKRAKHLRKWAKREGITCYRLYDRDLPEYAVAVDLYERFVHVQEYAAPSDVPAAKARARLREVLDVIPQTLGVSPKDVFLKVRRRQRGGTQYGRLDDSGKLHEVGEGGRRFLVEFTDRLDTGLFLDHRKTRALMAERSAGGTFLNLFCYTGAATVYAATAGATGTTSVDLSSTYLERTERNLRINGLRTGRSHELVRSDCLRWIDDAGRDRRRWDVVWLDPPTFSNSKSMRYDFEVDRDHPHLIRAVVRLLSPAGEIYFSTHSRGFEMRRDDPELETLDIREITKRTVPEDFRRGARPFHRTWRICRAG